jgi:hypothetical protein
MGYKYMGSHCEACDSQSGSIWDIHTFAAGPRLERIFAMMTPPMTETSQETVGTPRMGARVTFQEPERESCCPLCYAPPLISSPCC